MITGDSAESGSFEPLGAIIPNWTRPKSMWFGERMNQRGRVPDEEGMNRRDTENTDRGGTNTDRGKHRQIVGQDNRMKRDQNLSRSSCYPVKNSSSLCSLCLCG